MTKSEIEKLAEAHQRGESVRDLCQSWRINKDTLYEPPASGWDRAPTEVAAISDQRRSPIAAELYQSGLSLKAVGEQLGVDASTVRRYLADAGVSIRPRRGWEARR